MRLGRDKAMGRVWVFPGQWGSLAASEAEKLVGNGLDRAEQKGARQEATVRGGADLDQNGSCGRGPGLNRSESESQSSCCWISHGKVWGRQCYHLLTQENWVYLLCIAV